MEINKRGTFVISLDFELFWGVHDVYKKEEYENNVRGAHDVVLSLLEMFQKYNIHATWAIVGMIYFKNTDELQRIIPGQKPTYHDKKLSSYHYLKNNPVSEHDLDLFFAPYLIERISSTPNQEVATHTFSHYYCLEHGQTLKQFSADLQLAQQISRKHGREIKSIVFPRNQINKEYIAECKRLGLTAYRGNEESWVYRLESQEKKRYVKRGLRLLDRYLNLFGPQTFELPEPSDTQPLNIKSSRYLAKWSKRLQWLEDLRLKRILNDMTSAAKHGKAYHLWWHPYDFGVNIDRNLSFLERILEHYTHLQDMHGFRSRNMNDLVLELERDRDLAGKEQ